MENSASQDEASQPACPAGSPASAEAGTAADKARAALDDLDLEQELRTQVRTLKKVPACIRGPFTRLLKSSLRQLASAGAKTNCPEEELRAWKRWLLLPRLLLHPVGRGGKSGEEELRKRILWYDAGRLGDLLAQAHATAATNRGGRARTGAEAEAAKQAKALNLVEEAELSEAAKILSSPGLAPLTRDTYEQLADPTKRPPEPLGPLPQEVLAYESDQSFQLDGKRFCLNLRSARKSGAPGPSGLRAAHLKLLLDDAAALEDLTEVG